MPPTNRLKSMTTVQERSGPSGVDAAWTTAIEVAYNRRASHLWEYGRRLGLDPGTAEDGMQEVFARALHLVLVRRPRDLDAWLFRSLHNYAMDRHRQARRVQLADLNEPPAGPDDAGRLALWQEIDQLPLRQRQAVYLRYRADLDYPAIASVLGISESGARANVFRAMSSLRERIDER
jgi:RNA polymerase sigma factor (sigma-70 family)